MSTQGLMFWLLAGAIPLLAALYLFWPLLRARSTLLGTGIALLLLVPVTTVLLYQGVGSTASLTPRVTLPQPGPAADGELDQLLGELVRRLETQPDDVEGWLLLGRSYKSLGRHPEALAALERARALDPDDPVVTVELAEALIFTSEQRQVSEQVQALLEDVLREHPGQQKALWLLGIARFQAGDYPAAEAWWGQLLPLLEPDSGVARSVREQIEEARARAAPESWAGLEITVEAELDPAALPPGATLFVIARDPAAPRPPLGAVRLPAPKFPATVRLTDANSMLPQRPISGRASIELLARLSRSGEPIAAPGDLESAPLTVTREHSGPIRLRLLNTTP